MTRKAMIAGAAIAGLMSGSFAVTAHAVQSSSKTGGSLKMGDRKDAQKHACAGKNSCKGQGAGGKNECKGKGSCATDGSDGRSQPAESPPADPSDGKSQPAESPAE